MSSQTFAILVFLSFAVPIPLLVWLDRVPEEKPKSTGKLPEKP